MKNHSIENKIPFAIYGLCFFYLLFQPAIYTPDTSSYMQASIWRNAGYPSFLFVFRIFGDFFNIAVVGFQLLIGFTAIHLFTNKITKLLSLPIILKYLVIILLVFPHFPPLYIANNICSEGLSYPLYLFVLYFALHFVFGNKYFWQLFLSCTLLILTRGQFVLLPVIIAVVYAINHRKTLLHKSRNLSVILLILSIFFASFINKSFHKITRDLYISTPFTFINTSAAALYVSNASDYDSIENEDYKAIFKDCHAFIKEKGWTINFKTRDSYKEHYLHFHENLGRICNFTLHNRATAYYENKGLEYDEARAKSEEVAKAIFPVLVKNNLSNYLKLYYANLIHGFKSGFVLWFLVLIYLISIYKMLKTKKREYIVLFFLLSLILSNALIVSFGSHSIIRYLFYNYSLILIAAFQFFKSIIRDQKS